ncbi:MAG: hypothetical protein WAM46_03975 [Flavobacterium sp.]
MKEINNIFGCFMKIGFDPNLSEHDFMDIDKIFSPYLWGERGISNELKKLKYNDYGEDLLLALFHFNVKPTLIELQKLKSIGSYRKNEKSIGISIIINDENFFNKSELERYDFLKQSIFQKLDLLEEVVKKKKLDTSMNLLKTDLKRVLKEI